MHRRPIAVVLVLGFLSAGLPLQSQLPRDVTEASGSYKDPAAKAADAYGRGARAKAKADKLAAQGEAEKAKKHYERAKRELQSSVGLSPGNFDAILALGEVHLALGNLESARDACGKARSLRPADPRAASCLDASSGN